MVRAQTPDSPSLYIATNLVTDSGHIELQVEISALMIHQRK